MKKLRVLVLAICFVFVGSLSINATEKDCSIASNSCVIVTVEKIVLGQGYAVEPTIVDLEAGDTVADVFVKLMADKGLTYTNSGSIASNFNVRGINGIDTGVYNIPQTILDVPNTYMDWFVDFDDDATFPNLNDQSFDGGFGMTYTGWMYTVNDVFTLGMSEVIPVSGDVIRIQYTVLVGADLGSDFGEGMFFASGTALDVPNKDALIKRMAEISLDKDAYQVTSVYKTVYDNAAAMLINFDATQAQVAAALAALPTTNDRLAPVINVTPLTINLLEGDSANVTLTYDSGLTFDYAVVDNTIASYDNGVVKGLKEGTTKIEFWVSDDFKTSNKVVVDVKVAKKANSKPNPTPAPTTCKDLSKGKRTFYMKQVSGKCLWVKTIERDGNLVTTWDFKYINNKRVVAKKTKVKTVKDKKVVIFNQTRTYYSNGKLKINKLIEKDDNAKNTYAVKLTYGTNGKKKQLIGYKYKDGQKIARYEYKYNKVGQLKSNKNGNAYRYVTTYKNGKADKSFYKKYDAKGKLGKKTIKTKLRYGF